MNPSILNEFFNMPNGEHKNELRNKIIEYYFEEAKLHISSFLKTCCFKHNEACDYLDVYINAIDYALLTYDASKSGFSTYFKKVLSTRLYKEIGEEIKENFALFNAVPLSYIAEDIDGELYEGVSDDYAYCPRKNYESNEAKLVLRDSASYRYNDSARAKNSELQRKILIFRYLGFPLEEISEILKVNMHRIKYVLRDDKEDTPLGRIKLIFNDKINDNDKD